MKLYATTTSERASKGQGGNEFLTIKIQAGKERKTLSTIEVRTSRSSNGVEFFTAYANDLKIGELIEMPEGYRLDRTARRLIGQQIKGEKKKGECIHEWNGYPTRDDKYKEYCVKCGKQTREKSA